MPRAGSSSSSRSGQVAVEAVGGDRGGVDEPLGAGRGGGFEDVARAAQVDLAALVLAGDDHEGEVDDDVGLLDQRVDRVAVEDVAAPVFDLLPAVGGDVERAARHADHPLDLGHALERGEEGLADLPGRAGDGDVRLCSRPPALSLARQPRAGSLPLDLALALVARAALDVVPGMQHPLQGATPSGGCAATSAASSSAASSVPAAGATRLTRPDAQRLVGADRARGEEQVLGGRAAPCTPPPRRPRGSSASSRAPAT